MDKNDSWTKGIAEKYLKSEVPPVELGNKNKTADELDEMSQALRNMALEIPISVNELTSLTTIAGQLGIEKENLLGFTRAMADLGVAIAG